MFKIKSVLSTISKFGSASKRNKDPPPLSRDIPVNNEDALEARRDEEPASTDNLIDRSVKITFPKGQPYLAPSEDEIQEKVSPFGEVVNIGMKEKLAVVLFKTARSALEFSANAIEVFGPDFKVKYMGTKTLQSLLMMGTGNEDESMMYDTMTIPHSIAIETGEERMDGIAVDQSQSINDEEQFRRRQLLMHGAMPSNDYNTSANSSRQTYLSNTNSSGVFNESFSNDMSSSVLPLSPPQPGSHHTSLPALSIQSNGSTTASSAPATGGWKSARSLDPTEAAARQQEMVLLQQQQQALHEQTRRDDEQRKQLEEERQKREEEQERRLIEQHQEYQRTLQQIQQQQQRHSNTSPSTSSPDYHQPRRLSVDTNSTDEHQITELQPSPTSKAPIIKRQAKLIRVPSTEDVNPTAIAAFLASSPQYAADSLSSPPQHAVDHSLTLSGTMTASPGIVPGVSLTSQDSSGVGSISMGMSAIKPSVSAPAPASTRTEDSPQSVFDTMSMAESAGKTPARDRRTDAGRRDDDRREEDSDDVGRGGGGGGERNGKRDEDREDSNKSEVTHHHHRDADTVTVTPSTTAKKSSRRSRASPVEENYETPRHRERDREEGKRREKKDSTHSASRDRSRDHYERERRPQSQDRDTAPRNRTRSWDSESKGGARNSRKQQQQQQQKLQKQEEEGEDDEEEEEQLDPEKEQGKDDLITELRTRVRVLEAETRVRAKERRDFDKEIKRYEDNWSTEITALNLRASVIDRDNRKLKEALVKLKIDVAGKDAQISVISSERDSYKQLIDSAKFSAEKDALSTVLAQNKLVSLLDGQKESLSTQLSHLTTEVEKLRGAFRDSEEELIYWKTEAVAAKELLTDFKGKKGVQFAQRIAEESGMAVLLSNKNDREDEHKRGDAVDEEKTDSHHDDRDSDDGGDSNGDDDYGNRDDEKSLVSEGSGRIGSGALKASSSSSRRSTVPPPPPSVGDRGTAGGGGAVPVASKGVLRERRDKQGGSSDTMQSLITIPATADRMEEVSYRAMAREGIENYLSRVDALKLQYQYPYHHTNSSSNNSSSKTAAGQSYGQGASSSSTAFLTLPSKTEYMQRLQPWTEAQRTSVQSSIAQSLLDDISATRKQLDVINRTAASRNAHLSRLTAANEPLPRGYNGSSSPSLILQQYREQELNNNANAIPNHNRYNINATYPPQQSNGYPHGTAAAAGRGSSHFPTTSSSSLSGRMGGGDIPAERSPTSTIPSMSSPSYSRHLATATAANITTGGRPSPGSQWSGSASSYSASASVRHSVSASGGGGSIPSSSTSTPSGLTPSVGTIPSSLISMASMPSSHSAFPGGGVVPSSFPYAAARGGLSSSPAPTRPAATASPGMASAGLTYTSSSSSSSLPRGGVSGSHTHTNYSQYSPGALAAFSPSAGEWKVNKLMQSIDAIGSPQRQGQGTSRSFTLTPRSSQLKDWMASEM